MTNDETLELAHREAWRYKKSSDPHHSDTYTFNRSTLLEFARKLNAVAREECALFLESEARAWEEYMKTDEAKEAEEEDSGCSGYMSQARVDTLYEAATEIRERSNSNYPYRAR